jgi:hypothetical protein
MTDRLKTASILSILIGALAAFQAATGLLFPAAYRDNALVSAVWRGNDVVTLLVAVPLLAAALWLARRGSARALILWLGVLDYILYNYAFYLFGAAFNAWFLVYAALFGLALYALIFSLPFVDVAGLARRFGPRTPVRLVAGYMLLVPVLLGGLWSALALGYLFTGQVPGPVTSSGHITAIVFALDLTLVVPAMALGGVWLWQRRPWGYLLSGLLTVKGALYMLALSAGTVAAMRAGLPGAGAELPLWASLGLGALIAAGPMLAGIKSSHE